MTDRPTAPAGQAGRGRWLREANIPVARLRERFALNEADEVIWRTGPRSRSRAGRMGPGGYRAIHSVLDGSPYWLRESRVVWALKHGRWPPDGHAVDLGNRNRGDPEDCGFPGVRKTKDGKFTTSVFAKGRRFDFGPYDEPEEAYRIHLAAKQTLDPYEAPIKAISECARIDECKDWADRAAEIASYAAGDDKLLKLCARMKARAIRRCGELLAAAEAAGLSPDQAKDAPRPVNGVKPDAYDRMHAARRILRMARRLGDRALFLEVWDRYIRADLEAHPPGNPPP
jgi:hypothetical protein